MYLLSWSCCFGVLAIHVLHADSWILRLQLRACSYGLDLFLLSIDEGIAGYRDDSLETVKRNEQTYCIPLKVGEFDHRLCFDRKQHSTM